jgi:excisionase family DNA binding protein
LNKQDITKAQRLYKPVSLPKEPLRKRLLTVKEASVYLGMTIPALRERIWNGQIPIVRPDRRIFIDIHDLDKWIEQYKTTYTY